MLAPHLNFEENLFSVEHIGDDYPTRSRHKVLCQVLCVGLAVAHLPAEGEVLFKHFVTHIDKDRVHTCNYKYQNKNTKT